MRALRRSVLLFAAVTLLTQPACHGQARPLPLSPTAAPRGTLPGPRPDAPVGRPQMQVHDFTMSASGIELTRSTLANGRVKAPPFSVAAYRLDFEVFNAKGIKVYTGTLDHPLWHEAKVENPKAAGGWQRIVHKRPNWVFHLRLPAEAAGTRVAFFEVLPKPGKPATRRSIGEVRLPAPGPSKRP